VDSASRAERFAYWATAPCRHFEDLFESSFSSKIRSESTASKVYISMKRSKAPNILRSDAAEVSDADATEVSTGFHSKQDAQASKFNLLSHKQTLVGQIRL